MNEHLHIIFTPMIPALWLETLAGMAAMLVIIAMIRRARGALWRGTLFALLLLTLSNPSLIKDRREPLRDTALVVIDDSASTNLPPRREQIQAAADAMRQKLAQLPDLDVAVVHADGDHETDLFKTVAQKLKDIPSDRLAGIIALTDGQIHDIPSADAMPQAPFHALIAGKQGEIDRRISVVATTGYGIVGQKASVTLRVDDDPAPQSDMANVVMSFDDGHSQNLPLPVGKDVTIDIPVLHAGANPVAFEVAELPGELTAVNNAALVTLSGVRDRLRVLLVSGAPSIGGRQWLNLLKSDPSVDLIHFTILRSPFKDSSIPAREMSLIAFPAHEIFETKLHKFDLVVFDGFSNRLLVPDNYLTNIANYVETGGALLISNATGIEAAELGHSPLSQILPAQSEGAAMTGTFVPALNDVGQRHPVTGTLTRLQPRDSWSPWYRQIDGQIGGMDSETLMTGLNGKPLLVLAHVGEGRVAQFLSNQFWLWSRHYPNGGPETEMLRRAAHWLMKEPELDETALRAAAERASDGWILRIAKRSLHDNTANVTVTGPNNQPVQATLGMDNATNLLRGIAPAPMPGLYHVRDGVHDVMLMAGGAGEMEYTAMAATDKILAPVIKASGGSAHWLQDFPEGPELRRTDKNDRQSGSDWIGLRRNGQYKITGSDAYPLWPAWAVLAVLLTVAMLGWRREGK